MDRETIINGLEIILNGCDDILCKNCEFRIKTPATPVRCGFDKDQIEEAALALLKEQEPAMPTWSQGKAYCRKCSQRLPRKRADRKINYCGYCGQAVKWDA